MSVSISSLAYSLAIRAYVQRYPIEFKLLMASSNLALIYCIVIVAADPAAMSKQIHTKIPI
jgi:hypothetical protein